MPSGKNMDARLLSALPYLRAGGVLADVGTDHAYLPIEAVRLEISRRAVACDINSGPIQRAEANIREAGLSEKIDVLQTDGLHGVERFCPDDIAIFGMGGELMIRILADAPWVQNPSVSLILQPMTKAELLRAWLLRSGFSILGESLSYEGQYYQTIYARAGEERESYTPEELLLGRHNLSGSSPLLRGWIEHRLSILSAVIEGKRKGTGDFIQEQMLAEALQRRLRKMKEETT